MTAAPNATSKAGAGAAAGGAGGALMAMSAAAARPVESRSAAVVERTSLFMASRLKSTRRLIEFRNCAIEYFECGRRQGESCGSCRLFVRKRHSPPRLRLAVAKWSRKGLARGRFYAG